MNNAKGAAASITAAMATRKRCWKSQRGAEDEDAVEDKKRDLLIRVRESRSFLSPGYSLEEYFYSTS